MKIWIVWADREYEDSRIMVIYDRQDVADAIAAVHNQASSRSRYRVEEGEVKRA